MKKPQLDDYLLPAGSQNHVDYYVREEESIELKEELISQFFAIIKAAGSTVAFPNSSSHLNPFIMMVTEKGVKTQLVIQAGDAEEMDRLLAKANSLFDQKL